MAKWCSKCKKFTSDKALCDFCNQKIDEITPFQEKKFKALNFHYKDVTSNINTIEDEIKNLFGHDILFEPESNKNKLNNILNQTKNYYLTNKFEYAIANIGKLHFFIRDMKDIRDYDKNTFKKTRKQLKKHLYYTSFYGFRFEAGIMSLFIRQNINFKKQEAPDFGISYNNKIYYVECASVRFSKAASVNEIKLKIDRKILEKNEKIYANEKTILFMDITHMYGLESETNGNMYLNKIVENIKKNLQEYKFKCVVLFIGLYDRENVKYVMGDIKIYNEDLDMNLKDILNLVFPTQAKKINHILSWKEM